MNSPVNQHPTIAAVRSRQTEPPKTSEALDAGWLRQLCLDAGADDVGFVEVDRPALAGEHPHIQRAFRRDRKSTRLNSSHLVISYAVFCLKKKKYEFTAVMCDAMLHCTTFFFYSGICTAAIPFIMISLV